MRTATLIIKQGGKTSRVSLKDYITTIGRSSGNTILLGDIKLSRNHCQIMDTPGGYKLMDLGSANGTWVNKEKIKEHILKDGDIVRLGDIEIVFSEHGSPDTLPELEAKAVDHSTGEQQTVQMAPAINTPVKPATSAKTAVKSPPPPAVPATKTEKPSAVARINIGRFNTKASARPSFPKLPGAGKPATAGKLRGVKEPGEKEKEKKKSLLIAAGIGGVVLILIIVLVVFATKGKTPKGPTTAEIKTEATKVFDEIKKAVNEGNFNGLLEKCDSFREKYGKVKELTQMCDEVRKSSEEVSNRQNKERKAQAEWKPLADREKENDTDPVKVKALKAEIEEFIRKYPGLTVTEEAKNKLPGLEKILIISSENEFPELRQRVNATLIPVKKYDEAIKEYNEFIKKYQDNSEMVEAAKVEISKLEALKKQRQ